MGAEIMKVIYLEIFLKHKPGKTLLYPTISRIVTSVLSRQSWVRQVSTCSLFRLPHKSKRSMQRRSNLQSIWIQIAFYFLCSHYVGLVLIVIIPARLYLSRYISLSYPSSFNTRSSNIHPSNLDVTGPLSACSLPKMGPCSTRVRKISIWLVQPSLSILW